MAVDQHVNEIPAEDELTSLKDANNSFPRTRWSLATLSFVWAGLGQVVGGRKVAGITLMVLNAVMHYSAVPLFLHSPFDPFVSVAIFEASRWVLILAATAHAYKLGSGYEKKFDIKQLRFHRGLLFNFLFPGIGHLSARRYISGLFFLLAPCLIPTPSLLLALSAGIILRLVANLHLAVMEKRVLTEKKFILLVFGIFFLFSSFFVTAAMLYTSFIREHHIIMGSALLPTVNEGDFVFVDKLDRQPARGDLVVVRSNRINSNRPIVSRVVALGGETIDIRQSGVYVDEEELEGPWNYADGYMWWHKRVPEGMVYLLGDNLSRSYDSRYFGPVLTKEISGTVYRIYDPPKWLSDMVLRNNENPKDEDDNNDE